MEWKPIESAVEYLRNLEHLIERTSGGISTWGPVWVWDGDNIIKANYVEWDERNKRHSHWRTAEVGYDGDHRTLKPLYWTIVTPPGSTSTQGDR
jgi:hypothetical protein